MLLLCVCRVHITLEIQAPSQTFRSYCNTNKCNTMPSPWTDCKTLWRFLTELHYYTYTDEIIIYTLSTRPDRYSSHSFYLLKKPPKPTTNQKPTTYVFFTMWKYKYFCTSSSHCFFQKTIFSLGKYNYICQLLFPTTTNQQCCSSFPKYSYRGSLLQKENSAQAVKRTLTW